MTQGYDRLTEGPRTRIDRSKLTPAERGELRSISVQTRQSSASSGRYTTVYYLAGDERAAARTFVEENRSLLEGIDYSRRRNTVQTSVTREIYDLLLHELGVRELERYDTVVLETRRDGTQWVVDRKKFDDHPNARYRSNSEGSARVPPDRSLAEVFFQSGPVITETDVADSAIEFDGRQVLDYFRVAEGYPCLPTSTADGELAVEKLASPSSLLTEAAFARTYGTYDDPWQAVTDYRRVQDVAGSEPSLEYTEIADRLGLEPGTVRGWVEEGKTPAAVKGLAQVRTFGWLGLDESAPASRGLNVLVAWIFSGGSISQETYSPSFSIESDRQREVVARALDAIGVEFRVIREAETDRAREARPAEAASILGRTLAALGAPVGVKSGSTELRLPAYLHRLAPKFRQDFARTYVLNRGVPHSDASQSSAVVINEPRSIRYLKELLGLLRVTTMETVELDTGNYKLYLSDASVRALAGDGDPFEVISDHLARAARTNE